ncbi:MAG: metallophosphoesterase [Clostridia bacterium]|nr:metallophosphoesterase [Clostridia bacterium]
MSAKKKRRIILSSCLIAVLLILVAWTVWGNTALELNTYTVSSKGLPVAFDGYRIAHISDLHNAQMGNENENILSLLKMAHPDIIAITGDIIDSRNTKTEVAIRFAKEAMKIARCYYVSGNHEARISEYDELKRSLTELGVIVLEDESLELKQSGEAITLLGVDDPSFHTDYLFGDSASVMRYKLQKLTDEKDTYTVLLSHRPELFDVYKEYNIDLVLSGHAHGGQFRFFLVGGLVAPNQGLFPKYDAGLYTEQGTNMIVSRGIGNSILPFRFNNRPEVILIELKTER